MYPTNHVVQTLSTSNEPSIRFLLKTGFLGQDVKTTELLELQEQIKTCERTRELLSHYQGLHPYQKWHGAHWGLILLADLGYPFADPSLIPLREAELAWLLDPDRLKKVPCIENRYRRCGSMEGNAVYALVKLGLADERVAALVDWLLCWQWPDGGWNCDKKPSAHVSSFYESLIPLRGLTAYYRISGGDRVKAAMDQAAEVFLSRGLFRRLSDQSIIFHSFTTLHYPCFWHYDILFGLKVMDEGGYLNDPRCREALDVLESKQMKEGGFCAEEKYYRVTETAKTGTTSIDWGQVSKKKMNEFVTVDALTVLCHAGRITVEQ